MTPAPLMALVRELRAPCSDSNESHRRQRLRDADKLEAVLKAWAEQLRNMPETWTNERLIRRVLGVEEHGQSETHS